MLNAPPPQNSCHYQVEDLHFVASSGYPDVLTFTTEACGREWRAENLGHTLGLAFLNLGNWAMVFGGTVFG